MRWFALDHEVNPLWCRWDDCIHGSMVPVRTAMADLVVFLTLFDGSGGLGCVHEGAERTG